MQIQFRNGKIKIMDPESIITIITSVLAIIISCYSVWYTKFRKGKLQFNCTRWTAIGLQVKDQNNTFIGATIALDISIVNDGAKPKLVKDFLLFANTSTGKEIVYSPVMIFDITNYASTLGGNNRIGKAQKGLVPLPALVQEQSSYKFEKEILFMPLDKKTAINVQSDPPCTLKLYALIDDEKDYELISTQTVESKDIGQLKNGSFSSFESNVATSNRESFINKLQKTANKAN